MRRYAGRRLAARALVGGIPRPSLDQRPHRVAFRGPLAGIRGADGVEKEGGRFPRNSRQIPAEWVARFAGTGSSSPAPTEDPQRGIQASLQAAGGLSHIRRRDS